MTFKIEPYEPCPCGSGKKYKFCCAAKAQKRLGKYPLGTVAFYGPDDKTPTKIAAGAFLSETADPIMQRWVSTNIMHDEKIAAEVRRFFVEQGIKTVITHEGVLGCPHEEGEDYPLGSVCPFCPFWAKVRDEPAELAELEDDDAIEDHHASMEGLDASFESMEAIVGDEELDLEEAIERLYQHLLATLTLPCIVTGSADFRWEESYVLGGCSPGEYKRLKKTQPSYTDEFELLEIARERRSEWMLRGEDIVARVRRISDGKYFSLGLSELKAVDAETPNAQLISAYSDWLVNSR